MQPAEPKKAPGPPPAEPTLDTRPTAPAETPAALQSAPSLGALLHALRRSWKVVMPAAFLAAALAGGLAWVLVPAQYTSTLMLRLLSRPTLGNLDQDENFANVQKSVVAVLKSHDVLNESINKSRVAEMHGIAETPLALGKKLTTHFNDGPEMLGVMLSGETPESVAALLNAIGEVLPGRMLKADEERVRAMIQEKDRVLRGLAESLSQRRVDLDAAERKEGLDKVSGQLRNLEGADRLHGDAVRDLQKAERELINFEQNRKSALRRIDDPVAPPVPETAIDAEALRMPGYVPLLNDMQVQQQKIADIVKVARPEVAKELTAKPRAELGRLEAAADQFRVKVRMRLEQRGRLAQVALDKQALQDLDDRIASQRLQIDTLRGEVERYKKQMEAHQAAKNAPPNVLAIRDDVVQLEREQSTAGQKKAGLQGLFPLTPRLSLHNAAFVPTEKDYSRPIKYSLAAAALMFGACLVGGCLLEARSRKISDSSEIREGLGLRIIGTVPALPSSARRKSAAALSMGGLDSQYGLTEAVDAVRTRLLHAPRVDGARIIMITSATTGEGKTTLASHLAASLARAWRKTLLIDGDLRNPNAHLQFDVASEPGLSEALRGEMEYEDTIVPTSISRLWMLPAGRIDAHALQALTQDGLSDVFDRLKEQYDFIVIDTSPVIPVPDALVLGQQADAVILSVMRDVSRMPAVYAAQQSLEDLGIRVLGAVVSGEKTELYGKAVPYGPVPGAPA